MPHEYDQPASKPTGMELPSDYILRVARREVEQWEQHDRFRNWEGEDAPAVYHLAKALLRHPAPRVQNLEAAHAALQARLDGVAGLVEKWRTSAGFSSRQLHQNSLRMCADQLEAALKGA
jgi:hypothetical protein